MVGGKRDGGERAVAEVEGSVVDQFSLWAAEYQMVLCSISSCSLHGDGTRYWLPGRRSGCHRQTLQSLPATTTAVDEGYRPETPEPVDGGRELEAAGSAHVTLQVPVGSAKVVQALGVCLDLARRHTHAGGTLARNQTDRQQGRQTDSGSSPTDTRASDPPTHTRQHAHQRSRGALATDSSPRTATSRTHACGL